MSKLIGLYENIYDFENLYQAYISARKSKRFKADVLRFSANLEERLIEIQNELMWHTYKVGRYKEFFVFDPKKRLIMALNFKDRVVQWAIYRILNPLLDKKFIDDSYGCRIGKGTHRAANRLQYWLRQVSRKKDKYYYLKLDISKYFYSVDHDNLIRIIKKKIADKELVALLAKIIRCEDTKFGIPFGVEPDQCPREDRLPGIGMPIGSLIIQMFANLYLNELDQYAKHNLKLRYYIRYMDDIIILHHDKKFLHQVKADIERFLNDELLLSLNNKTTVKPINKGIEFVGLRIFSTHRKLKKKSLKKMKNRIKYLVWAFSNNKISDETVRCSIESFRGIMKHFNSYGLRKKLNQTTKFTRRN